MIPGMTINLAAALPCITVIQPGGVTFATPGSYVWTAPLGVCQISIVAVGAGGSGRGVYGNTQGGGGGALAYANSVTVVPGCSYTICVGCACIRSNGQPSYWQSTSCLCAGGGSSNCLGFSNTYAGGGGGAGGYYYCGGTGGRPCSCLCGNLYGTSGLSGGTIKTGGCNGGVGGYAGGSTFLVPGVVGTYGNFGSPTGGAAGSCYSVGVSATYGNGGGIGLCGGITTSTIVNGPSGSAAWPLLACSGFPTSCGVGCRFGGGGGGVANASGIATRGGDGGLRIIWSGTAPTFGPRYFPCTCVNAINEIQY